MTAPSRLRLRVSAAAERQLRAGHPWLYASSLRDQNREGEAGELAVVYDRQDRFLAIGLYDPHSPLRLRVLHAGAPQALDQAWWTERLERALAQRSPLRQSGDTDGYRLINGESDGFPGLVLDRYAGVLVLKLYSSAWFRWLELLIPLWQAQQPHTALVLRLSRNIAEAAAGLGYQDGQVLYGEVNEPVLFRESGLTFEAQVRRGQKTGFFLDQRDNRRQVRELAAGKRVLNAFSFTGGFSLYAAAGGASAVTSVDISAHALEGARRNFALNPALATIPHQTVQADVFAWLEQTPQRLDLIILDPPSLAKREQERAGALRAYQRLARSGIQRLNPGGLLLCASCSAHVSAPEFFATVREVVQQSGRPWREVRTSGHALDHPATFPEAEYLKAIYLELGERTNKAKIPR